MDLFRQILFALCNGWPIEHFNSFRYLFTMSSSWVSQMTFLVEGVFLLLVACIGLLGNILSFILLSKQGLQKTFHNLLLLLNIFDMVRLLNSIVFIVTRARQYQKPAA